MEGRPVSRDLRTGLKPLRVEAKSFLNLKPRVKRSLSGALKPGEVQGEAILKRSARQDVR